MIPINTFSISIRSDDGSCNLVFVKHFKILLKLVFLQNVKCIGTPSVNANVNV